ncbi:MAG: tRNA (adenosine(37)-N6)-threonylcarbamoyltransferase complex dimerization subunit type 1 TsaB [Comamonadaceae bacterium PBBC2]|nr:MAG: tRNA (adenosine(37)-N6)-threonylcarbamoyltransferase complex dimerization subunit type 1 TsaB [Comamonadaceae bacterium PBBC2]
MKLLAFDTSTDTLSIAVGRGSGLGLRQWQTTGVGGAQASATLIAQILSLMQQAQLQLQELDAICFGCGPGSFTGLRTACSVAQGLAYGAGVPVLPIHSLLALAEEARFAALADLPTCQVTALLDARMDEMYAARFSWDGAQWSTTQDSALQRPQDLQWSASVLAGNVFAVYGDRLGASHGGVAGVRQVVALPSAGAMLRLAPGMLAAGLAVDAAQALPHYIRDKVAQTTAERDLDKARARAAAAATTAP